MTTSTTVQPDRARWITVRGARTHNLQHVSVRIPKHALTVFTGVSGSGKSSLALSTIAAEAQRLSAETYPLFIRTRLPHGGGAMAESLDGLTFTTIVDQRPFTGNARSTVGTASDLAPLLRMLFSRFGVPSAGFSPAYSFNDPSGMCPRCEGLGVVNEVDVESVVDRSRSLNDGAILFPTLAPGTYRWKRMVRSGLVDPTVPVADLDPHAVEVLLHARGLKLDHPLPGYPKAGIFDGVIPRIQDTYLRRTPSHLTDDEREALARVIRRGTCPGCGGSRVNDAARASVINGRSIADWSALPLEELNQVAGDVQQEGAASLVAAIRAQCSALIEVGLGYLTCDRASSTLSGGEAQRVRIVRHLGSALSDVCYVFDEPTAGLHPP